MPESEYSLLSFSSFGSDFGLFFIHIIKNVIKAPTMINPKMTDIIIKYVLSLSSGSGCGWGSCFNKYFNFQARILLHALLIVAS